MATRSSILAWKIPWTEEPGELWSKAHEESDTIEHTCIQAELDVQGDQVAAEDLTRALILSSGVQKE